jgi:hypothetical protein
VLAPAGTPDADGRAVHRAITALRQGPRDRIELRWVDAGEAYDLHLHVADGLLWLLPSSGQWFTSGVHRTPSIRIAQPAFDASLADALWRIGRVQNLLRIAGAVQDGPDLRLLQVDATVERGAAASPGLDTLAPTRVGGGDLLKLKVRNIARAAVDLTVLYIDAAYGITALYPQPRGASNRIEPGAGETVVARIDTTTTGLERLLLIAVQARAQGESLDFSFLEQARLVRSRSGAGGNEIVRMFEEAGFGSDAASAAGSGARALAGADRTDIRVFDLIVK